MKNTLIHEMIHAWLVTRGVREGNGGHGPRFQAKANEINCSAAPDFQVLTVISVPPQARQPFYCPVAGHPGGLATQRQCGCRNPRFHIYVSGALDAETDARVQHHGLPHNARGGQLVSSLQNSMNQTICTLLSHPRIAGQILPATPLEMQWLQQSDLQSYE